MASDGDAQINEVPEERGSEDGMDEQELTDTDLSQKILLQGIKKLVMNSVKRKEIRDTVRKFKRKRSRVLRAADKATDDDSLPLAYSRCSISMFYEVIEKVLDSPHMIQLVKDIGFEFMLEINDCCIPRAFAQWLADHASSEADCVILNGVSIYLTPEAVQDTFHLPAGDLPVLTDQFGKDSFLSLFGLSDVPTTRFFVDKIVNEKLSDDMFIKCFMTVCNATFLCPMSSTKPSTKYMGALVDVHRIKHRNWPKFVNDWLRMFIKKYLKDKLKQDRMSITLGGCIYHLSVRCLDHMDFGLIKLPAIFPRIRLWKGDLIKNFSQMAIDKNGKYGALPIKHFSDTCYGKVDGAHQNDYSKLRDKLDEAGGSTLSEKEKDQIMVSFKRNMENVDDQTFTNALSLVLDVIQILAASKTCSGDTLVVESSNNNGSVGHIPESPCDIEANTKKRMAQDDLPEDSTACKRKREACETKSSTHAELKNLEIGQVETPNKLPNFTDKKAGISTDLNEDPANEQSEGMTSKCVVTEEVNKTEIPRTENKGDSLVKNTLEIGAVNSNEDVTNTHQQDSLYEKSCSFNNMMPDYKSKNECQTSVTHMAQPDTTIFDGFNDKCTSAKQQSREEYLKEARKKYFFKDPSCPSFRLLEFQDDNGKYIEERELWRPLNYHSDNEQNQDLEDDQREQYNYGRKEFQTPSPKVNVDESDYETIVQCAQRPPQFESSPTNSALNITSKHGCARDNSFIDLTLDLMDDKPNSALNITTDDNAKSSQSDWMRSQSAFERSGLLGRKLFQQEGSNEINHSQRYADEIQYSSPECEITGEKIFKDQRKILGVKADDLYNTKLSLGNSSSVSGKENEPPRRYMNPSKFVSSPYDINERPRITDYEEKLYEAITTLCDLEEYRDEKAINIDNCTVSMEQIGKSFKPEGWVEAYVINAFCRKLFRENHPSKSKKHYFFHTCSEYFLEKWKSDGAKIRWKENVIKSFHGAGTARKLHLSDRLYFPSHYNDHWFVFAVDIKGQKFIILDSLFGQNSSYHNSTVPKLRTNFVNTWYEAGLKDMDYNSYDVVFPKIPKQETGNDCGIFAMKIMELWCPRNPAQYAFTKHDIPYFRKRLSIDNIFNTFNKADDARKLIRNFSTKSCRP